MLRAELPDMSGLSLCGALKKQRNPLSVVLISSDAAEAFPQHQAGPTPADGYLAMPFAMEDLSNVVDRVLLPTAPNHQAGELAEDGGAPPGGPENQDIDKSLDSALGPGGMSPAPSEPAPASPAPPPITKGPPKLPKRERRSVLTDDDRQFLEEGLWLHRQSEGGAPGGGQERRPPSPSAPGATGLARREAPAAPRGGQGREAQIARLSEIWAARERELLSVEDRLHDKDVEAQGLKMQSTICSGGSMRLKRPSSRRSGSTGRRSMTCCFSGSAPRRT